MTSEKRQKQLLRMLKRFVGPFSEGSRARKQLTLNQSLEKPIPVKITFYGESTYKIKVIDGFACAMSGSIIVSKVPFVPWDELDEQYDKYIEDIFSLTPIPDELLNQLMARFDEEVW